MDLDEAAAAFRAFAAVVKALRTPGTGCPWDLEQTHRTLRPYLLEEAHEVLEAIDRGDDAALREELGDLLLQVVLHAQLADDRGAFSITEVARGITEKMVRRHPHVFGSERVSGAAEVLRNWERIKAAEKPSADASPFDRVPQGLPALARAQRLGEKAAKLGADAGSLAEILATARRQLDALEAEVATAADSAAPTEAARARLEEGLGELLFGLCQLGRRLGVGAEDSLRGATRRFVERFRSLGDADR